MARSLRILVYGLSLGTVLAQDAILSVLGNGPLTGQTVSLPDAFDLRILCNATHALHTLSFLGNGQMVGWASVGRGTGMADMDAYVLWPSSPSPSNNWTLSHRTAAGNSAAVVPSGDSASNLADSGVQLVPALTSATAVSFVRPLTLSDTAYETNRQQSENLAQNQTSYVWAFSSTRPSSNDYAAAINIHSQKGIMMMDLSTPFTESVASTPTTSPSASSPGMAQSSKTGSPVAASASLPYTSYDMVIIAHAAIGSVAVLLLAPAAILLARFGRGLSFWFGGHRILQTLVAVLMIVTFALGVRGVQMNDAAHFNDAHKIIGLVVFLFVLLQVALGILIHALFDAERTSRPLRNFAHIGLGIATMGLSFSQSFTGFSEYQKWTSRATPLAVVIISAVLVGLTSLAYFIGVLVVARRQRVGRSWSSALGGKGFSLSQSETAERRGIEERSVESKNSGDSEKSLRSGQ